MALSADLEGPRARWRRADAAAYDATSAAISRYLGLLDEPLLAECRGDVLELACGTGRVLVQLAGRPAVRRAIGLDLAAQMLAGAAARGCPLLVRGLAETLPFRDASLDTVICTFFSMRDMDRPRAYREAARVLRPGGRLAYTLRNFYFSALESLWQNFLRRGRWPRRMAAAADVDGASRDVRAIEPELQELRRAGLRVVGIRTVRFLPFLRRWLRPGYWRGAFGTRLGADIIVIAEKPLARSRLEA